MLYFGNNARKDARQRISALLVKLGNLKPSEHFTLGDIHATRLFLGVLDDELKREIRKEALQKQRKERS